MLYTSGAGPVAGLVPQAHDRRMHALHETQSGDSRLMATHSNQHDEQQIAQTSQEGNILYSGYNSEQSLKMLRVSDLHAVHYLIPGEVQECGVWHENTGLAGNEIPGASRHVADRDACKQLCLSTPGCNAVTFNKEKQWCWIQEAQNEPKVLPSANEGDILHICKGDSSLDAGLCLFENHFGFAPTHDCFYQAWIVNV